MLDKLSVSSGVFRRILVMQVVLLVIMAILYGAFGSIGTTQAAVFGGAITLVTTLLQMWQASRINRVAGLDIGHNMRFLYRSWLERLVLTAALFAAGIVILKMNMPAMIVGFITGQAAVVIEGLGTGKFKRHG